MQEMWVPSLGLKDTLEKEMSTTPVCPWESPWIEEPGRLQFMGPDMT